MKTAFGFRAHSGWAALVVLGESDGQPVLVDRRRVELTDESWAKAPYHAAEELKPDEARDLVRRGVEAAHRIALREMKAAVEREQARGNAVAACAVLVGSPMPGWSTGEILAVHFRMHKAEGALFKDALAQAAGKCGLRLVSVPEKGMAVHAARALRTPESALARKIAAIGKPAGPPWGKDQKEAALAALVGLKGA